MARFAVGKDAYGISDRSGFRYRLRDMRKEWNGLLVGYDEWEEKHPQLEPVRHPPDAEALRDPRPDTQNIESVEIKYPIFNLTTLLYDASIKGSTSLNRVTVQVTANPVVAVTGSSITSSLGSVTVVV